VIPRSELGHDAAEGRVHGHLAREPFGADATARLVDGYARLVATGFDPKHAHSLQPPSRTANMPLFCRLSRPIFVDFHHRELC